MESQTDLKNIFTLLLPTLVPKFLRNNDTKIRMLTERYEYKLLIKKLAGYIPLTLSYPKGYINRISLYPLKIIQRGKMGVRLAYLTAHTWAGGFYIKRYFFTYL